MRKSRKIRPSGLSPHTRGNPSWRPLLSHPEGSIPAHTGEPVPASGTPPQSRVYPRTHGGTQGLGGGNQRPSGLSPHTRGNLPRLPQRQECRGSIPAHTGEPETALAGCLRPGVYPRTHGGTPAPLTGSQERQGLSPHTRGNRIRELRGGDGVGSIPAHTGEPPGLPRSGIGSRVYPRTHGGT